MNIDRIERLILEFIEELENAGTNGNYHILNCIDALTSALIELEEMEIEPEFTSDD